MALPGCIRIIFQSPIGAFVDYTKFKKGLIIIASIMIAFCSIIIALNTSHKIIFTSQILIGIATSVFTPTIAAITLGMVGYELLAERIGRNESYNHVGNICNAIAAGLIGYFISYEALFYLVAVCSVASCAAILLISDNEIDNSKARAMSDTNEISHPIANPFKLIIDNNIIMFGIAIALFSISNGSMLSLASQRLYIHNKEFAAICIAACIVVAQIVMVFIARVTGRIGSNGNRKIMLLLAFLVVPIRGSLYLFSNDSAYIISIQILDGIGGGIFGVLTIIMIADLTEGTGRFNFIQGVMTAIISIGTAISSYLSGIFAEEYGYNSSFLFLSLMGILSFLFVLICIPNTKGIRNKYSSLS